MLTVLIAIIVGTGMASALINLYYDVDLKMRRELRTFGANLIVVPADTATPSVDHGLSSAGDVPAFLDAKAIMGLEQALADRSVQAKTPYYYFVGKSAASYLTIVGSEIGGLRRLNAWWKIEGRWIDAAADPPQCMVGRHVANQLGLSLDQALILKATSSSQEQEYSLRIVGLIETGAAEDNQVLVALPTAWKLSGETGIISSVAINALGTASEVEHLAQHIEAQVSGLRAKPLRQIAQSEGWVLAKIKWMMLITIGVILIITAICAMTTLAAMVLERRKEVALMKALGAGNFKISRLFMAEMVGLGAVGGLIGYLCGLGMAFLLEQRLFHSTIALRPELLPLIILIACLLLMSASLLAVRRALDIQPAVLLKGE